jgi:hypothetical protein
MVAFRKRSLALAVTLCSGAVSAFTDSKCTDVRLTLLDVSRNGLTAPHNQVLCVSAIVNGSTVECMQQLPPTLPLSLTARGYRRDAKQGRENWLDGARFRYQHARRADGRDVAERRRVRHTLPAQCAGTHSAAPGCESGTPRKSCRILHIGASCSIFYETAHLMCFISSPAPSRALRLAYPYVPPYMLTWAKQILSPIIAYRRDRAVVYLGRLLHEPILVLR